MRRLVVLVFLIISSSVTAFAQNKITVQNKLKECIEIKGQKNRTDNNLLLLDLEFRWVKPTGHCGCTSAVNSYFVREHPIIDRIPVRHTWGKFVIRKNLTSASLLVTSSYFKSDKQDYHVEISCVPHS